MTQGSELSPAQRKLAQLACVVACLFFGYGFALRVSPAVMVEDLMRDFAVTALILGNLSAFYFYPYALLQIPIGLWIDRIGPRWSMTVACAAVAVGCYLFASATSIGVAYAGRCLIGIGCALTWPGLLMIVHQWFPHRFAFLAGVGQLGGMLGGVIGQAPLAAAVSSFGWRSTLLGLAAVGVVLCVLLGSSVRNRAQPAGKGLSSTQALKLVLTSWRTWTAGVYGAAMAGQVLAFGGLWGVPFLVGAHGLERTAAAGIVSLQFVGLAGGAMVLGWWSDRTPRREIPMLSSAALSLLAASGVIYLPGLDVPMLGVLTLLWGVGAGGLVLGFAAGRAANPSGASGLAVGLVNTFVIGGGALMQLVIGLALDLGWQGSVEGGVRSYTPETFRIALSSLLVLLAFGAVSAAVLALAPRRELTAR